MSKIPNYETARAEAGFSWFVGSSQSALREVVGIPIREFNLEVEACIEAYRKGRPLLKEMFGDDIQLPAPATPAISYGHVNGLGSELIFPDGGEVGHTHIYKSLEQGINALKKPVDFAVSGMAPFYIDFLEKMKTAFPGEEVGFSYGWEGPLTTAYELRGEAFFTDIFDNLALAQEFLRLTTESILEFCRFVCRLTNRPLISSEGTQMYDDIASMIPPYMWDEFVIPFWEKYFSGRTTGKRSAHVEDLRAAQLKYLERIGLSYYDPSISPKLNPEIISRECRVPFGWRLGSFHYRNMDSQDVRDFVFKAAADGASTVFTFVAATMCNEETVGKVHIFIQAAKEVEKLLEQGINRVELQNEVSISGKKKFWDCWLD